MKLLRNILLILLIVLTGSPVFAQPPALFNYQSVLRDADGQVIASENVTIEISILQDSPQGNEVFTETHQTQTSPFGHISLQVGSNESLENIPWGEGTWFIQITFEGTILGTSQLLSVPYALYSLESADSFSGDYNDLENTPDLSSFVSAENPQDGDLLFFNGTTWQLLPIGSEGQILTLVGGIPQWANIPDDNGDTPTTVTDIDGNIYTTVILGEQEWMTDNLRTTRFNNGMQIEYPGDNFADWLNNTSGAYAWYNNDETTYKNIYGALYNFPAVNNGNLCPIGWRVPSVEDWNLLIAYMTDNYEDVTTTNAGNALKSCRQVNSPLGGDCNTTEHPRWNENETHFGFDLLGFTATPGGNRLITNQYDRMGMTGYFWTSTPAVTDRAHQRYIHFDNSGIFSSHTWEANGNSVRCMRDVDPDPPSEYTLTLQVSPSNAGTVSGEGDYAPGTSVILSAFANEDYEFSNWTNADGVIISEDSSFNFIMPPQNITLIAHFTGEENGFGSVTDIEGNEYLTITVGTLEWMAENLKTTKFNNGEDIDFPGTDDAAWGNNTTGAYAWYNNDISNKDLYGALYNWYAVNTGNLCPAGWRVPSQNDWNNLSTFLINNNEHLNTDNLGNALKSCRQVDSPLGGDCDTSEHPRWDSHFTHYGTDEFGFSGFPGGRRFPAGNYDFIGLLGHFWTSNQFDAVEAHYRSLSRANGRLNALTLEKQFGFSIRCVRDAD